MGTKPPQARGATSSSNPNGRLKKKQPLLMDPIPSSPRSIDRSFLSFPSACGALNSPARGIEVQARPCTTWTNASPTDRTVSRASCFPWRMMTYGYLTTHKNEFEFGYLSILGKRKGSNRPGDTTPALVVAAPPAGGLKVGRTALFVPLAPTASSISRYVCDCHIGFTVFPN